MSRSELEKKAKQFELEAAEYYNIVFENSNELKSKDNYRKIGRTKQQKIEPNTRDKEYSAKIRELLAEDNGLNKALLKLYKETIKSLCKRNLKICLLTIEIYNKLQDLVQN